MKLNFNPEQFIQSAGDAIVVCDAQGLMVFWNTAAQRVFGYSADEALGQSLDLIIPERLRARHWEGYEHTMHTRQTRYGAEVLRVPATHKDGRALSIAFTVSLLNSNTGELPCIAAIIRDDTRQWQEERTLRQRLREMEAAAHTHTPE